MQLRLRLDFLRSMTRNFSVYWSSTDLVDTLWDSLVVDPIGPQEQDETFSALESNQDYTFVMHLYDKRLPTLDIAAISHKAWLCVRQSFLFVNWHRGNLTVVRLLAWLLYLQTLVDWRTIF